MLLALLLVAGLTACGGTSEKGGDTAQTNDTGTSGADTSSAESDAAGTGSTGTDDIIIVVETSTGMTLKHLDGTDITTLSKYHYQEHASDGMLSVWKDNKYGAVDMAGNVVVEPVYDKEVIFSEGLAAVVKDGKYGYVDKTGAVVIDFQYDSASSFLDGLAAVRVNGAGGYIDTSGAFVVEPVYEITPSLQLSGDIDLVFIKAYKDKTWYYFNTQGEEIVFAENAQPYTEDSYWMPEFCDGLTLAGEERNYGYVDAEGNTVIEPQYYEANNFSEGLALVQLSYRGDYGFIDTSGNMVIEPQFLDARSFSEGLAAVRSEESDHLWGYIDTSGNMVIEPQFDEAFDFSDGYALVSLPGEEEVGYGFIDTEGNLVLQNEVSGLYGECTNHHGIAIACPRGGGTTVGFVDVEKGEWIYEPQFSVYYYGYENGIASVGTKDDDKRGVLDVRNRAWILEPESSNCEFYIVDATED
jgi:hypothetical protein